ncbi:biliverdin reductase A-like [Mya arenaria]|uniref:biliverdin reductase A-like n=1 Tax=Mya arenaria TaxID=6604 RepID=UPI0022E27874|nr:biliverdin reductase A-like [Mya arenaria]XP_052810168.1 biliverdin reductase A-like [Mya arenaria]
MPSDDVLGVVVIGVGIAGRVRIRDLGDTAFPERKWNLIGYVSRRTLEIADAHQITEEEALTRPDVDVIVLCTEPHAHESVIRRALEHGKHVLVEFPVATSARVTEELYTLAEQKGLILHEENIALLTPSFRFLNERLQAIELPITSAEIHFTGSYNGWTEDFEKSGGPFCANVSLLQTIYVLLGNCSLTATGGQLQVNDDGFLATAKLSCEKCKDITITIKRTREKSARSKEIKFVIADGTVVKDTPDKPPPTPPSSQAPRKPGLFMEDWLKFVAAVRETGDHAAGAARTRHCIRVADALHAFMGLRGDEAPS